MRQLVLSSVVHEPARAESRPGLEPARLMAPLDSRLEPPRNRQETAKRLVDPCPSLMPRESSRLVDPCSSRLEPPRDSSPLVDPCSSLMPRESSLMPRESSPLEPSPDLDSSRLGSWHPWARRTRARLGSSLARVRSARAQH